MSDIVISVENLAKKYRIKHQAQRQRYVALRDVLADRTKSVARRLWNFGRSKLADSRSGTASNSQLPASNPKIEDFWALKDVSFEVKRGEVVGIIGRNGAGKSTLLKILSRITEPTTGRIHLRGRVASLLEVGTGFHPELTGRENIFLNGAILGMTREEIKTKFDEIVAFAEIERFLDTPVKRYSSGMYVRLAFAVAAHLEPEILIVDEVLAVGDAEFQKKCLGKMEQVSKGGRTVLVVSHNFGLIRALCTSGLALNSGRLIGQGDVNATIGCLPKTACSSKLPTYRFDGPLQKCIRFQRLRINGHDPHETEVVTSPHDPLQVEVEYEVTKPFQGRLTVALSAEGSRVLSAFDRPNHEKFETGRWISSFRWPPRLLRPHLYTVSLGAYSGSKHGPYLWGQDVALFQVGAEWNEDYEERSLGLVNFPPTAERNRLS